MRDRLGKRKSKMRMCATCGASMRTTVENYRYSASGLRNVVLKSVLVHRCRRCGDHEVDIPRILDLHQAIARALATKQPTLAPAEIRFLRKHLGFSGSAFAREMGVTPETVSRWENGALGMGLSAERLLRLMVLTKSLARAYGLATTGRSKAATQITAMHRNGWSAAAAS